MTRIAIAVLSLACISCGQTMPAATPVAPAPQDPPAKPAPKTSRFDAQLLEIAKGYLDYGRVDDEARWAPELCRMPRPSTARFSASADEGTHGRKLYFLFASDRRAYVGGKEQPVGQTIVKEAWGAREIAEAPKRERFREVVTWAERDGKVWHTDAKSGLYIMFRTEPGADTDEGWVYGTVTADGAKVTSSGRVASCMGCHTKEADRVFGLQK